jgi:hypothetical protein
VVHRYGDVFSARIDAGNAPELAGFCSPRAATRVVSFRSPESNAHGQNITILKSRPADSARKNNSEAGKPRSRLHADRFCNSSAFIRVYPRPKKYVAVFMNRLAREEGPFLSGLTWEICAAQLNRQDSFMSLFRLESSFRPEIPAMIA